MLILIFRFILGLQSQIIDFTNAFCHSDIPSGEPLFIELTRYFKSDVGQYDISLRLKKSIYDQAKSACLWYEKLRNSLLNSGFGVSKVDPCLFISKTGICVVYVDGCIFLAHSQYEIDNSMKSFKEYGSN